MNDINKVKTRLETCLIGYWRKDIITFEVASFGGSQRVYIYSLSFPEMIFELLRKGIKREKMTYKILSNNTIERFKGLVVIVVFYQSDLKDKAHEIMNKSKTVSETQY